MIKTKLVHISVSLVRDRNCLYQTPTYFIHQHRDVMKQLYIDIFMHKMLGLYLAGPEERSEIKQSTAYC